ncbi:MAG: hypothetical protein WBD87_05150 [Candidatus Acidiferrales bacterium]
MTTGATETLNEAKETQTNHAARGTRKTPTTAASGGETQRFFLAKTGNNSGVPEFGKELSAEPEAIVESLKTGLHYFVISEWRGVADFSGKKPQLGREPALSSSKTG